jgi:hypothetical protein
MSFFYRKGFSALHPALNLDDQIYVFMFSIDRVAQLYHQKLGSLSVAFCD